MTLDFLGVKDAGNFEKERLELLATSALPIGSYAVFCAAKAESGVSSFLKTAFWFPDADVEKGDRILVYTTSGEDEEKKEIDGTTTHVFFWHRTAPVWGEHFLPVLIQVAQWWILQPKVVSAESFQSGKEAAG